jgi:ABC-type multidrug transport system ATPase subunit
VESREEAANHHPRSQAQPIVVKLHQYVLGLRSRSIKTFWKGYSYRTIIQSNNATFEPGMLNIILGASGCGKTTLLNSLCHRLQPTYLTQYVQQGKITFNDLETSAHDLRGHYAYATQHSEALLPALTVRETLIHAAALRLSGLLTPADRAARVADLILSLGLQGCADTLIGSDAVRGISGGEKRRLALAVQILNDPQVLLIDEPTSGLDAFTANSIMQLLYDIAKEGRTVIVAIHQPRSDLFAYFGNILLLSEDGHTIYSGLARNMIAYFAEAGHECPQQTNPADFALDLTTVSQKSLVLSDQDRVRVHRLVHLWRDRELGVAGLREQFCEVGQPNNRSLQFRGRDSSFYSQVFHLLYRATKNTLRQPQLVVARIMQSSGVAIIFTLFFAPLGHDYSSIQNRFGLFQQLGGFYIIGMLTNAAVYPFERDNAYNEIQDRIYAVDAFLASYTILELPFEILNSFLLGLLLVFAIGLPRTAPSFFVASLAGFSGLSCGESLGIIFNTLFSHTGFAMNLMSVLLAVANAMAGILSLDMPDLFKIFNYLSPIRYQVRGVAYYSLIDQIFECDLDSNCPLRTGQEALALYNFDGNPMFNIVGMALCAVIYRLIAWSLLRILRQVRIS